MAGLFDFVDFGTALDLLSTGVKVYGAFAQGDDAQSAYNAQANASMVEARRALLNAREVEDVARQQAEVTRRQGIEAEANARAGYAASGVDVNYGTARDVQTEIGKRAEEDALNSILYGERQARREEDVASAAATEAGSYLTAGKNAKGNATLAGVGSLIAGGASAYSKWKQFNAPPAKP